MPARIPQDESAETIIRSNLAAADEKQSALFEIRLAYLRELARAQVFADTDSQRLSIHDLRDGEPLRERLEAALSPTKLRQKFTLKSNAEILTSLYSRVDVLSRVQLCRELIFALAEMEGVYPDPYIFFEVADSLDPDALGRVSYVQNAYTETTYTAAASRIKNLSSSYVHSYELSCDEVYSGRSEFCILPIENTVDGKLFSFYALIDKYDLKIPLVFNVTGSDDNTVTRFALCRRSLLNHISPTTQKPDYTFLEIRILPGNTLSLNDIMTAAAALGLVLRRVDSLPLSYTDSDFTYSLIFCTDKADLVCFLAFLSIWAPYYIPIGYYKEYSGYTISNQTFS